MTLQELRALAETVERIPCDDPHACEAELHEFNASVTRFRELVVLVRNRLVVDRYGPEPQGAAEVRALASALAERQRIAPLPWSHAEPPAEVFVTTPARRR